MSTGRIEGSQRKREVRSPGREPGGHVPLDHLASPTGVVEWIGRGKAQVQTYSSCKDAERIRGERDRRSWVDSLYFGATFLGRCQTQIRFRSQGMPSLRSGKQHQIGNKLVIGTILSVKRDWGAKLRTASREKMFKNHARESETRWRAQKTKGRSCAAARERRFKGVLRLYAHAMPGDASSSVWPCPARDLRPLLSLLFRRKVALLLFRASYQLLSCAEGTRVAAFEAVVLAEQQSVNRWHMALYPVELWVLVRKAVEYLGCYNLEERIIIDKDGDDITKPLFSMEPRLCRLDGYLGGWMDASWLRVTFLSLSDLGFPKAPSPTSPGYSSGKHSRTIPRIPYFKILAARHIA
ncbi:hypothetical protein FB45DRAFT_873736 [Roridomyces roridus]|uniref:Uncharacterized protein n=1 Tax=Roridomyces roridus TaxID=1738132 RepID=A0AAD7BAG3_9AGAR|nr:hypothetical protein FB45DRAFT_873736 [Roridomyces roridus]